MSSIPTIAPSTTTRPALAQALALHALRLGLGVVLLFAAWYKATDYLSFARELWLGYRLPAPLVTAAFFLPPIEAAVGLALVLDFHARRAARTAALLLVIVSLMLILGVTRGELETCGCGGLLDARPTIALLRNLVLGLAAVWIGWRAPALPSGRPVLKAWIIAVLTCFTASLTGTSSHEPLIDRTSVRVGQPFPAELVDMASIDVRRGRWVVFGFSATCSDCWDATHQVRSLEDATGVSVVGLTASDEAAVAKYVEEMNPSFPIVRIDAATFSGMQRELPTSWLVIDGRVVEKLHGRAHAAPTLLDRLGLRER